MTTTLNLNMFTTNSNFNLSFLLNMGASRCYYGEEKINNNNLSEEFKSKIPKNQIFEISSMIFNITKHRKEIISKYKCIYEEKSNSLVLILSEDINFSEFSKEIMMNLFTFCQKVDIKTITFLVAKKNPQFIRIMQDLIIVGFKPNEQIKTTIISGNEYKVMEIDAKIGEEIEEFFF